MRKGKHAIKCPDEYVLDSDEFEGTDVEAGGVQTIQEESDYVEKPGKKRCCLSKFLCIVYQICYGDS